MNVNLWLGYGLLALGLGLLLWPLVEWWVRR